MKKLLIACLALLSVCSSSQGATVTNKILTAQEVTNLFSTTSVLDRNGINLTNLNASELRSGTVPLARLSGITDAQIDAATDAAYRAITVNTNQFDVTAYGAVGDGVHNDTELIQNAINAASVSGGGVVLFPTRTYGITAVGAHPMLYLSNNVSLRGDHATLKVLAGASRGSTMIDVRSVTNTTIEGLIFNGNWLSRKTAGGWSGSFNFEDNGLNVVSTNIIIRDCQFLDIGKDGINNDGAKNMLIDFCLFDRCGDAGLASDCTGLIVTRSTFVNCGWELGSNGTHVGGIGDVASSEMIISQCTFSNNWQQIWKQGGTHYVISQNLFNSTNETKTNIVIHGTGNGIFSENTFYNGVGFIIVTNPSSASVTDLRICNNSFYTHWGIFVNTPTDQLIISENNFINTTLSGVTTQDGIVITQCTAGRLHIKDNLFHVAGNALELGRYAVGVTFSHNVISSAGASSAVAIWEDNRGSHKLLGNTVLTASADWSFYLYTATNCIVKDNFLLRGIHLMGASNTISENTLGTLYMQNSGVKSNIFRNNTIQLVTGNGDYTLANYWVNNLTKEGKLPYGTNQTIPVLVYPMLDSTNVWTGSNTFSGTMSATAVTTAQLLIETNAVCPTPVAGRGHYWNSNYTLYWVTPFATNLIKQGLTQE